MATETRLENILESLNKELSDITPYRLALIPPGDIQPVSKNAHYMSKKTYDRLVANIREDGNLSSLPFCWKREDGTFVALSGNHRVKAATAADVKQLLVLYTDAEMDRSQQIAIQLSHNAIVGEDNPTVLRELWEEIDVLRFKVYSGLDEDYLETLDSPNLITLSDAQFRFEPLTLYFVAPEIDRIEDIMEKLGRAGQRRFVADVALFDEFFDLLLNFKETADILNTSTAFMAMISIIEEWLSDQNALAQDVT